MKIKLIGVFLLLLFVKLGFSQGLEFYREDLSFKLDNQVFSVDGLYYFCNTSNDTVKHDLLYPFPSDETYIDVDTIFIIDESSGKTMPYRYTQGKRGVYFGLELLPYSTATIRIYYEQKISGNQAEYILVSTKAWGKPFELVNYSMVVSKDYKNLNFSYEPDSVDKESGIYYWKKRDFMPDKNFIINFESEL